MCFILYRKISKYIVDPKVKDKTMKPPEETMGESLLYFEISKNFLTRTHEALLCERERHMNLELLFIKEGFKREKGK